MPPTARILLVDDHEDTLYALESALAPLGHLLGRATSGDEALKQLLRGNVGLLLLDVHMPGMGGLDVVRHMRRLEQTRHVPVVLLTGFARDRRLGAAAYRLGVADLVTTPVDPWALRTKVRHLYDAHQRRLALEAEIRALRARLDERGTPPARPAPSRPHAHVPPAQPPGAHTAELEEDRT
ncbi:two-component system response regulator [Streptomyces sp. NPDC052492]|uniref:Response regulator n=1 Tax=Streptomyces tendae TaxID=1932 RepID=A0ABX5ZUU6_STRTE|nr:response regulator [Streptomyces tendae]QER88443.1 response regulator [Streptomyces tendae]